MLLVPLSLTFNLHPHCSFSYLVYLTEWVMFLVLQIYLHMSSPCNLLPEGHCRVFYATRFQVYWNLTHNVGLLVLWFDITKTYKQKQSNRVFQIVLCSRGNFFFGWWGTKEEWSGPFQPFSKLKTTFCKYWTLIKIKNSINCGYKEYEVKIKMEQEQWLQLKIKFLLNYTPPPSRESTIRGQQTDTHK